VTEEREIAATEPTEAALDALWSRVLEAWDDDKPHHALLEYALRMQKLPDVAGRYRALKEKDAEKAARAQKKLDGIVVAATQMLMSMKSPPDKGKVPPAVPRVYSCWRGSRMRYFAGTR
jgi:hypothetical protein